MKKYLAVILLFIAAWPGNNALAQMQGLGVHFGGYDFLGPQNGDYFFTKQTQIINDKDNAPAGQLPQLVNDTVKKNKLFWNPLIKVTYWFQLNKWFDINLGLSLADLQYPASSKDTNLINKDLYNTGNNYDRFLGELDARINFNILPKKEYIVTPYIFAGITASYHNPYWGADVPLGLGGNVQLSNKQDIYLNLEAGYKAAITTNDYNHLQYTAGIVYWFKPGYKKHVEMGEAPVVAAPAPDMDNDGVPDSIDKCPTIPGLAEFDGCPDTDGDGVPDNLDKCPLVPGLKAFDGCPDTDGDGIPDNIDKCPYVAGTADNNGCPPPDRDHDGVPDNIDKCPDEPGPASNFGCPVIERQVIELVEKAARSVYFETGKAVLKKISFTSLDKIVNVMKNNPKLYIDIGGYTDSVGSDERNIKLSDDRANVCKNYLESKGVAADHITAKGYGKADPVATNKTALGRAQNRRTEFKLRNYAK